MKATELRVRIEGNRLHLTMKCETHHWTYFLNDLIKCFNSFAEYVIK